MISILDNIQIAWPELAILVTAVIALLADIFLKERCRHVTFAITCAGLVIAAVLVGFQLGGFKTLILNGHYIGDDVGNLMKIFIYISGIVSFVYGRQYLEERKIASGDYYILGLFSTLGMSILVSAHSLLTIYLGLELLSLPLYAMVAMYRSNGNAAEAAMKYFVMGAIASGMLLYGMSLLYGATGKLNLLEISEVIATTWSQNKHLLAFSLVFIVAGLSFKMAAVPFHMWAPDVYQGAPGAATVFVSAGPKIAALAMVFRLLTIALPELVVQWQQLLLVVSVASVIVGNLVAISQNNLKRMFAYSAISHSGYVLFGVLAATQEGYASALYYMLVYSLMSLAAFGLLVLLSRQDLEVENIEDLKGLNRKSPWLAFMMMLVMFSMAGVPPVVGFWAKLLVLKALVDANMITVAVVGLLFAVVGAFYYLRVVKTMYFDAPDNDAPIEIPLANKCVYSLNCLVLLYLGLFPAVLITACINAFA